MKTTSYENYQDISLNYDTTRKAIGINFIISGLKRNNKKLKKQKLLDMGCGTGNHILALSDNFDKMIGLDENKNMLEKAKRKMKLNKIKNVKLKHGSMTKLPFKKNEFDSIITIQTLHHLSSNNSSFPEELLNHTIAEVNKILKPEGIFIINMSTHYQIKNCFWWAQFIPNAIDKVMNKHPTQKLLLESLIENEFHILGVYEYLEEVLQGEQYYDPMGPLNKEFRDGDSTWSLATEDELKNALIEIKRLNEDGEIHKIIKNCDINIREAGQSSFIICQKF